MKTPDEIEKEIMEKWRPVTMKQAIHNTIWYMLEQMHLADGKRHVLVGNEWVEPTDEFNAIVDGIYENLYKKQATDADKSNPVGE